MIKSKAALICLTAWTCISSARNPVQAQAISVGGEYSLWTTTDADHAKGIAVAVRPIGPLELRFAQGKASSSRTDVTCGRFDEGGCTPEPVRTRGKVQSWFIGWRVPVMRDGAVTLIPELGFARLDGTRDGANSGRSVTKRGDYIGIGLRGAISREVPKVRGLSIQGEIGVKSLLNPTIGESLDAYDPYREGTRVGVFAASLAYRF